MIKFIAIDDDDRFFGCGSTPEESIEVAQERALDYDGDQIDVKDFRIYEVRRKGKAIISFEWESE